MTSTQVKNHWFVLWYSYRFAWLQYTSLLEIHQKRDELECLVKWAYRKKLAGVCEYYQGLLDHVERQLLDKAFRYPQLAHLTDWVYCAQVMLNPPPSFYPKGAAAKYRLCNRSLI